MSSKTKKAAKTKDEGKTVKTNAVKNTNVVKMSPGRRPGVTDDMILADVAKDLPVREKTIAAGWFKHFKNGITVGAYIKAGGPRQFLNHSIKKGWVKVSAAKAVKVTDAKKVA